MKIGLAGRLCIVGAFGLVGCKGMDNAGGGSQIMSSDSRPKNETPKDCLESGNIYKDGTIIDGRLCQNGVMGTRRQWALVGNTYSRLDAARNGLKDIPNWSKFGYPDWSNEARIVRCDKLFVGVFVFPRYESADEAKRAYLQIMSSKNLPFEGAPLEVEPRLVDYANWCPGKVSYAYRAE